MYSLFVRHIRYNCRILDKPMQSAKKEFFHGIKDELPITYVFHTREGSIGILQILNVEVLQAIEVRYKILAFSVETEKVKVEGN